MRYSFFSDIHASKDGLAKLFVHSEFIESDKKVCLGDIINAHDEKTAIDFYERVKEHSDVIVVGNHEAVLVDGCPVGIFNQKVQPMISSAKATLASDSPDFLKELANLPKRFSVGEVTAVHASYDDEKPWQHVRYIEDVQVQENCLPSRINILGHGHIPFIAWVENGLWYYQRQVYGRTFVLNPDTLYLINCGSVLGSREMRQYERTFIIYDDSERSLRFINLEEQ